MGTNSKIEWTHHSWNPWRGCCHVSPGCDHCYAERQAKRNPKALGQWGKDAPRVIAAEAHWKLPFRWNRAAEEAEISQRVFCASLADVFEDRPDLEEPRRRIFATIDQTPWLDWLLVTKRPHNIRRMWPAIDEATADATILMARAHRAAIAVERSGFSGTTAERHVEFRRRTSNDQYRLNVWLLTTVENQAVATQRIPWLSRCGDLCPVLGLSGEPLLEYVDLTHIDNGGGETYDALRATVTTHRGRTFRTRKRFPCRISSASASTPPAVCSTVGSGPRFLQQSRQRNEVRHAVRRLQSIPGGHSLLGRMERRPGGVLCGRQRLRTRLAHRCQ